MSKKAMSARHVIEDSYENLQAIHSHRPNEGQLHGMTAKTPKPLVSFFKGEPQALGATQIFVGVFILAVGIALALEHGQGTSSMAILETGVTYWSGMSYIISGSLSLAASFKPSLGKVKASLGINIISSIAAVLAIIILSFSHAIFSTHYSTDYYACYEPWMNLNVTCEEKFNFTEMENGIMTIILLFTILMLCVTISTSVFGCRTVCRSSYNETNIILYQTNVINAPNSTTEATSVSITPLPFTQHIGTQG